MAANKRKKTSNIVVDREHEETMARAACALGLAALVCTLASMLLAGSSEMHDVHTYIAAGANLLGVAGVLIGMWCRQPFSNAFKTTGIVASAFSIMLFVLFPIG